LYLRVLSLIANMASFGTTMYANAVHGAKAFEHTCPVASMNSRQISGLRASTSSAGQFAGQRLAFKAQQCKASRKAAALSVRAVKDGAVLDRPLRVAVVGGGPSGACTAETLAKGGIETYLLERKMDNCKVGHFFSPACQITASVVLAYSHLPACIHVDLTPPLRCSPAEEPSLYA